MATSRKMSMVVLAALLSWSRPTSVFLFFLHHHRLLHSFPTRRSSDLARETKVEQPRSRLLQTGWARAVWRIPRSEEHTSELQSRGQVVCRLVLEKTSQ